jgi:hypothetical protein
VVSTREDLDFSHTLLDRLVRLSLGELPDFSGAKYDGDFTVTRERRELRTAARLFIAVGASGRAARLPRELAAHADLSVPRAGS